MKKPIAKSVRLSEKVYDYINAYSGDGFNDKFENIILFAMENEVTIKGRIQWQQEKLDDLYAKVRDLEQRYSSLNNHLYCALRLNSTFKQLYEDIEKVSQNSLQQPSDPE